MVLLLSGNSKKAQSCSMVLVSIFVDPESEFNEFEPRLKSAKNRFQLSVGLNLEHF